MEFIWTIPLFLLPLLILFLLVKGIKEYKVDKSTKRFKQSVFTLTVTVLYYLLVFSSTSNSIKYYEQEVSGRFRSKDSVVLTILPHHSFTLQNKINNKYVGDGNWEVTFDDFVLLTLHFENGESLRLKYLPQDSMLVGDNELTDNIVFFACNTKGNKHQSNINDDCTRGPAEPIINKDYYPNTTFVLQPDSLTGIETVIFDNGDRLTIKNWGCEYYVLTFSFETTKYKQDTSDLLFWHESACQLMSSIVAGIKAPIDIKKGIVSLESYYLKNKGNKLSLLKLGEEIDINTNEIRSFVMLDRIEKVTNHKFRVSLSFVTGPL